MRAVGTVVTPSSAVRPDAIRRHNLTLLLEHIHRDGALTRAELTQRLRVSRSTVGALVADLTALGLVVETVPSGGSGVGRPSHVVVPSPSGPWVAAVDVDVNRLSTAAVGLGGTVLARSAVSIDPGCFGPADLVAVVREQVPVVAAAAGRTGNPAAVGISVPGTVDAGTARVGTAPNLGWRDIDLAPLLSSVAASPALPVVVGNDADLAVLAEHRRGRARDCDDVVFLQGRVGIGAGIIVNGALAGGHDGHAGEIGHVVLDADGPVCHCGNRGCVEVYLGAQALVELDGTASSVDDVFAAARRGAPDALRATEAVAAPLARTVALVVNTLNPQRVLLGGHLAELFDLVGERVRASLRGYSFESEGRTLQLAAPALGADAALIGAAEAAFTRVLADPFAPITDLG